MDTVWWTDDADAGRAVLARAGDYLGDTLRLTLKQPARMGWSRHGLVFCGFRVLRGRLLLTRRRKRRFRVLRAAAEHAWLTGRIDTKALQSAWASALALTVHADARSWRQAELRRRPVAAALAEA